MESGVVQHFEGASRVDAGRDRALGGFVGLVALAGSLSALQADGIVTPDATVVLAGILVLAAVGLSITWRSAAVRLADSSRGLVDHAGPVLPHSSADDVRLEPSIATCDPSSSATGPERGSTSPDPSSRAADVAMVVRELSNGLASLASGDLTARIAVAFPGEFQELRDGFNDAMERNARSIALARRRTVSESVLDSRRLASPGVVTRLPPSRRSVKVDLFAGRMSEFIELRDTGASARQ